MEPIEVLRAPTAKEIRSQLDNGIFLLLFALFVAAVFVSAAVYTIVDHTRFMQDARPATGIVQSIEHKTRTGRRGRTIIDYYAFVQSSNGVVRLATDDPLPVGMQVDYLYSPSMNKGRIPDSNLQMMVIVGLLFTGFIGYCGWRSYKFFRSWYRFSRGHFIVVSQPKPFHLTAQAT